MTSFNIYNIQLVQNIEFTSIRIITLVYFVISFYTFIIYAWGFKEHTLQLCCSVCSLLKIGNTIYLR